MLICLQLNDTRRSLNRLTCKVIIVHFEDVLKDIEKYTRETLKIKSAIP